MKNPDSETPEKLRGGFYTPKHIAELLATWAASGARHVLEPSAGDGIFLKILGELDSPPKEVSAVEIDPVEAGKAGEYFRGFQGRLVCQDYLDFEPEKPVDAVVGNPPFIRYQYLSAGTQLKAQALYETLGLRFTKHTNAWVPFLVKSLSELEPGGRLAMVIPAELLNVLHAGAAREYLLRTCESILVLDTDDLLFDGTLQRTILLAAVRRGEHFSGRPLVAFEKVSSDTIKSSTLAEIYAKAHFIAREVSPDKWMDGLLTSEERDVLYALCAHPNVSAFNDLATVQVGIVTGANSFFVVSKSVADEYSLHKYLRPMFGRSSHVRGLSYTEADHQTNMDTEVPCLFLDLNAYTWDELSSSVQEYLIFGESLGLHKRYKTRIRKPWWKVPSVYPTSIGLLKRASEAPRLIANEMQALTTDTAYRIDSKLEPKVLTVGWLNSLTLLACELNGRTYGGGVLELVPSEIRRTPIPAIKDAKSFSDLDIALRRGASIEELMSRQNEVIAKSTGLDLSALSILENARQKMLVRRTRKAN